MGDLLPLGGETELLTDLLLIRLFGGGLRDLLRPPPPRRLAGGGEKLGLRPPRRKGAPLLGGDKELEGERPRLTLRGPATPPLLGGGDLDLEGDLAAILLLSGGGVEETRTGPRPPLTGLGLIDRELGRLLLSGKGDLEPGERNRLRGGEKEFDRERMGRRLGGGENDGDRLCRARAYLAGGGDMELPRAGGERENRSFLTGGDWRLKSL